MKGILRVSNGYGMIGTSIIGRKDTPKEETHKYETGDTGAAWDVSHDRGKV